MMKTEIAQEIYAERNGIKEPKPSDINKPKDDSM